MTLKEQIALMDDMIKENDDCTIRDFLELKAEIIAISSKSLTLNHGDELHP